MSEPLFDLDLLRTLIWAAQTGSFKEAAERVGRTAFLPGGLAGHGKI